MVYPAQENPLEPQLLLELLYAPPVLEPNDAAAEIFLRVSAPLQCGHFGNSSACEKLTIFSNFSPQLAQWYSYNGIYQISPSYTPPQYTKNKRVVKVLNKKSAVFC